MTFTRIAPGEHGLTETLRLPYFPWQLDVRTACLTGTKTLVLACAARIGKDRVTNSLLCELPQRIAIRRSAEERAGALALIPRVNTWIVAPTKKLFKQNWEEFNAFIPQRLVVRYSRQDGEIKLRGDIRYSFKSADDPESLVSEGVDVLAVLEASRLHDQVAWEESLIPRLESPGRFGLAIISGTPRNGRGHWFRRLYERAKAVERAAAALGQVPTMRGWNLPMSVNPLMADKVAVLREKMQERFFNIEVMGLWPDDDEKPFRDSDLRIIIDLEGPKQPPTSNECVAIDIGRTKDLTFAVAGSMASLTSDAIPTITDAIALRKMRLHPQITRVAEFCNAHPGPVIVDSTALGGHFFADELERALARRVIRYDFHGARVQDLYDNYVLAAESHSFRINANSVPRETMKIIHDQHDTFECDVDENGTVSYHGPGGTNDDAVTACALWWHRARPSHRAQSTSSFEDYLERLLCS